MLRARRNAARCVLERSSAGLQLLQRSGTRLTVSRVGYHRQKRRPRHATRCSTTCAASGRRRRRALLNHFGSVDRILAASQEELEGVPGLPEKTARAVYAQLHKAGPTVGPATSTRIPRVLSRGRHAARRAAVAAAGCGDKSRAAGLGTPRRIPAVRSMAALVDCGRRR